MTLVQQGSTPFNQWLRKTHPEVRLTPMQQNWVNRQEGGGSSHWIGGKQSGKTFIFNLYKEYKEVDG